MSRVGGFDNTSPQFDVIVFHSNEDVDKVLDWFDRLYSKITDEVGFIEASLNSLKAAEDRDATIANLLLKNDTRYEGKTPEEIEKEKAQDNALNAIPDIITIVGFHTKDYHTVPSHRVILEQLQDHKIRQLETVFGARKKLQDLRASIMFGERPVLLIWESLWYVLGHEFFFSPKVASEFFCLRGECSAQSYPFLYIDPYFSAIPFLSGGSLAGAL